jgi:hexokinase
MRPTSEGDGEVIAFKKEVKAPEVHGSLLGVEMRKVLSAKGWKPLDRIAFLNDTTASLLAGAAAVAPGKQYSSYVGIILGTGLNVAYIDEVQGKKQIVVTEAGGFTKLPRSDFDLWLDNTTAHPGEQRIEKMCSGAYLGAVITLALRQAAKDGLFSKDITSRIIGASSPLELGLKDVDDFLYAPHRPDTVLGLTLKGGNRDDAPLVYAILDAFMDRSARLAASLIASAVIKSGEGTDPTRPVCVLAEGTTFTRSWRLRGRCDAYLEEALRRRGLTAELVTADNAVTLGAAVAGLTG